MSFAELVDARLFSSMLRMSTPIVLVALGGVMTSQAGILNISLEGTMLLSAFFAVLGSYLFQSALMGISKVFWPAY